MIRSKDAARKNNYDNRKWHDEDGRKQVPRHERIPATRNNNRGSGWELKNKRLHSKYRRGYK
jgi:hypothetical protein